MVRRVLIVADSVLEIMLSMWLAEAYFKNDEVTLVITDRSANSEKHFENISGVGYFRKVYHFKAQGFPRIMLTKVENELAKDREVYRQFCLDLIGGYLKDDFCYDCFVTSEIDIFSRSVYKFLKNKNSSIEAYLLGEAIYAYKALSVALETHLNSNDSFKDLAEDYKTLFLYKSKLKVEKYHDVKWLPEFKENLEFVKEYINKAFTYIPNRQTFENKIIFFEESHVQDGGTSNDVQFVKHLVEKYGKERVLVKRHPRTRGDRFSNLGVEQIEEYFLPWELFVLNNDCRNCILCAASSLSLINMLFWDLDTGNNIFIMLYNIIVNEGGFSKTREGPVYYKYLYEFLEKTKVNIPVNINEFDDILKKVSCGDIL